MARRRHGKLTAREVETINKPGRYGDGGGLYLQVTKAGTKSWLFRYMLRGKARAMGLGPYPLIGLADARSRADDKARLLLDGIDPLERKRAAVDAAIKREGRTFRDVMEKYIEVHRSQWTNAKHSEQWRTSLERHAANLMELSVAHIGTEDVLRALEPIWTSKTETATRVRQRIEAILD